MTTCAGAARRAAGRLLLAALPALGAACASQAPAPTPSPPPASYVVLLENEDGTTGAITVTGPRGQVVLDRSGQAARIDDGAPGPAFEATSERIASDFAAAGAARPRPPEEFRLYFMTGASALAPASERLVDEILAEARARPGADVSIIGHTDTRGTAAANERLGLERAEWVARLLRNRGLRAIAVTVTSHGESDPLIRTPDETSEARNRRVQVIVR